MTAYTKMFIKLFSILLLVAALCSSRAQAANPTHTIHLENTAETRPLEYRPILETDSPTTGATSEQGEQLPSRIIDRQRPLPNSLSLSQTKASAWTTGIITDTAIAGMIEQVSQTEVFSLTGGLSGEWPVTIAGSLYTIEDRYTDGEGSLEMATEYVSEQFTGFGLSPFFHEWHTGSLSGRNVIGEIIGESRPKDIFIITAHLDAVNGAPGADDNASGSVAVLMAAQILSQYNWDCTLRFASFTGEEQGLLGSRQYAEMAANRGDNILGVLNLDMIGYDSDDDPAMDLHIRTGYAGDLAIATLFSDVVAGYALDLKPEIVGSGISASDHASFWSYGYPAILAIEDYAYPERDFNPYYHSTEDNIYKLNPSYFTNFVKAAVGTFAHMGCLAESYGALTGTITDATTGEPVPGASIRAVNAFGQEWTADSDFEGFYEIHLPGGNYSVNSEAQSYWPSSISEIQVTRTLTPTLDISVWPTHSSYLPLIIQSGL